MYYHCQIKLAAFVKCVYTLTSLFQVNHVHQQEIRLVKQNGQINQQNSQITQLNNQTSQQTSQINQLKAEINQLKTENKDQSSKISQQASLISDQNKQMSQQSSLISRLQNHTEHIETGLVNCGDSTYWTESPGYSINKPVSFTHSYDTPPMIQLSAVYVDKWPATDYNVPIYELYAVSVTQTGFTLRCKTQAAGSSTHIRWDNFKVSWASFPQYRP